MENNEITSVMSSIFYLFLWIYKIINTHKWLENNGISVKKAYFIVFSRIVNKIIF